MSKEILLLLSSFPIFLLPFTLSMSFTQAFDHLKIPLQDIKSTTNNFDDNKIIGRGGFGKVYKGELLLSNGLNVVAIKRLDSSFGQGGVEFWKEIMMLFRYKHENIVSLIGFCDESGEKILVYEYLSNKSLDMYLSGNDLSWIQRLRICIGAARGLQYLHDPHGGEHRILHRDIKSANILLDQDWKPKISDFGLAKFGPANQEFTFLFTYGVGTIGYCDPLYVEKGFLTKESDVYSFGVVLFEVLCGRLCVQNYEDIRRFLPGLAQQCYEEKKLDTIIDNSIKEQILPECLERFSTLAYQCLRRDRAERPSMAKIIDELELVLECQVFLSSMKKLKLQFRGMVSQPVFTGMPLLGENETRIEIVLVDAVTEEIVNNGILSKIKLEIFCCRVDDVDDSWTYEDFEKRFLSKENARNNIIHGNTCVQLIQGSGFVGEIRIAHRARITKSGWYRLGAIVVDAALKNEVKEVAWSQPFLVKGKPSTNYAKQLHPSLFDRLWRLQGISKRGNDYKRLEDAGVYTVLDFLNFLYIDPTRLKDILEPITSKSWDGIINDAQKSDGMFVYFDPSIERNGVVLDVRLQLKGLIVESNQYLLVHQLSDDQKVEAQKLVKFACEHFHVLHAFKDETSVMNTFSLGDLHEDETPPRPSFFSVIGAPDNMDSSDLHMGQSTNQAPVVTSSFEWGTQTAPFDYEMIYSINDYQEHMSFHSSILNERHAYNPPTEPGTSFGPSQHASPSSIARPQGPSECNKIIASHKKMRFDYPQVAYPPDASIQYSAMGKAHRRWKIVSSIVKWFSLMSEIRNREVIRPRLDGNMVGVSAAGFN